MKEISQGKNLWISFTRQNISTNWPDRIFHNLLKPVSTFRASDVWKFFLKKWLKTHEARKFCIENVFPLFNGFLSAPLFSSVLIRWTLRIWFIDIQLDHNLEQGEMVQLKSKTITANNKGWGQEIIQKDHIEKKCALNNLFLDAFMCNICLMGCLERLCYPRPNPTREVGRPPIHHGTMHGKNPSRLRGGQTRKDGRMSRWGGPCTHHVSGISVLYLALDLLQQQ